MLRAYIDESYSDDWFFMAAAVGTDAAVTTFDNLLEWFVIETARDLDLEGDLRELHGFELFQGRGPWANGPSLHERLAIAGRALQMAAECDIRFIIRGIDRKAQRAKYPTVYEPYPLVLTHTFKAINEHASKRGHRVDICCDEIHHDDRHRAMLERHRMNGTPGYQRSKLAQIVGELEFVASHQSQMVQLADIVAYLRHRQATKPNPARAERRARDHLWSLVSPQIAHEWVWTP